MRYHSNVEAVSFDEFVQYGRDNGANIVNGMPWSFNYKGYPVSHENDTRYLIMRPTAPHTLNLLTDDMLVSIDDYVFIMKADVFNALYTAEE